MGAAALAIAACVPYALLKLAWLAGSSVGAATPEAAASLHDARHSVGNAITLGMDLIVVVLALALTVPKGLTLPAPLGLMGQAAVGGSPAPADNELQPWVYAVVYGGFIVQAAGLLTAFLLYARVRWPALFRLPADILPRQPERSVGRRVLTVGAAAVGFAYAGIHIGWAVAGDDLAAPPGFETVAQRLFLAMVGLLVAAGAGATLILARATRVRPPGDRMIVLISVAWVGTGVAFGSGVAELGLAPPGSLAPLTAIVLVVGALSGATLGAAGSQRIADLEVGARIGKGPEGRYA